jgi:NAD+ kinase
MIKKVILFPNLDRDTGLTNTKKVYKLLCNSGVETVVCPFGSGGLYQLESGMHFVSMEDALPDAGLIITLGGDGTILRAARTVVGIDIPLLGINLGHKGFLAELEPEEIALIQQVLNGDCKTEHRMMLDVCVYRNGKRIYSDFAFNDAVIGSIARVVELTVSGDGRRITSFSGDGVVMATPAGSTAYSMSAGGPIVEPSAENIIVTPICAHVLLAKAFVLAPDRVVTVEVGRSKENLVYLSADGGSSVNLALGDIVEVKKSGFQTRLIRFADKSFYERVSEKLGEIR